MKNEWIDTSNCEPLADGDYMVQTVFGDVISMMYTAEGGWNTFVDNKGVLHGTKDSPHNNGYIVRWLNMPRPDAVPEELLNKYMKARKL